MSAAEQIEPTIDERIAGLPGQWRWLIRRADAWRWHGFALNEPGTTLPNDDGTRKDASKMPRWGCADCRKARKERGLRGRTCYAECGHPRCHGLLGATDDVDELIALARDYPRANTAVRTGACSDLFVLDLDGPEGQAWRVAMEAEHGPDAFGETLELETGSGGTHLAYEYPARPNAAQADGRWHGSAGKIARCVDIRAEDGLIVCPGSRSAKGAYRTRHNRRRIQPPEWLLQAIEEVDRPKRHVVALPSGGTVDDATIAAQRAAAPNGVHPYVAATFEGRIADFRALTSEGSARSHALAGAAMYLVKYATASPPTGLTEDAIRDALVEACNLNGFTAAHGAAYRDGQIESGLDDGRGKPPPNWPPKAMEPRISDVDREILAVLDSGDADEIEGLVGALGQAEVDAVRAKHRPGTVDAPARRLRVVRPPAATHVTEPRTERDAAVSAGLVTEPEPEASPVEDAGLVTEPQAATSAAGGAGLVTEPDAGTDADRINVRLGRRDFSELYRELVRGIGVTNARQRWLYLHGTDLVEPGRKGLVQLGKRQLGERLARRMRFYTIRDGKTGPVEESAPPPWEVVETIEADGGELRLPEIDRVARAPFYGPDGTLQAQPGYHAAAKTLYIAEPGLTIPEVSTKPTEEETQEAFALLRHDLLGDFPFVGPADVAGQFALMLTPFVRAMIKGPTPLFLIDAPTEGTGKGLQLEVGLLPSAGDSYSVAAAPTRIEEWHKSIVATLRSGPVAAVFDNVNDRLDSGALASAVTAYPNFHSRILGVSENETMPLPAVWVATGNNCTASREVARRIVRSRIDSGLENPGERGGWRHEDLRGWATENRGRLIHACLTLIQAWIAAGRPVPTGLPKMGSFESWVRVVGSILAFHGVEGLLANREALTDQLTGGGEGWGPLIAMMAAELEAAGQAQAAPAGTRGETRGWRTEWTASQLVDAMAARDIVPPVNLGDGKLAMQARQLSYALTKHRDRRHGDHVLKARTLHGVLQWRLEPVK